MLVSLSVANAEIDQYGMNFIVPFNPPNITAYWNSINGWNQTAMTINVGNSATFNITVNQTITNVSWNVSGTEEQNTSSMNFTRAFDTIGTFNVTAQAFNANGSSDIIYTVVTVAESGGGGTDWDYAYGWVKHSNGTPVITASVTTSAGTVYTNAAGYYSYGYVFVHGNNYNFNITKSGYNWSNQSISFAVGDYQVVNATIDPITVANAPNITSWSNDNTSNNTLVLTVQKNTNITFNVTANQTITTWTWIGSTQINGSNSNKSYAYKNFTSIGVQTVSVSGVNANGTTQTITWTITVLGAQNLTLSGYVFNELASPIQNSRIDFNNSYKFTDSLGYYEFTNVSEGTYSILARAIGYANSTKTEIIITDTISNFTLIESAKGVAMVSSPGFEAILVPIALLLLFYIGKRKHDKTY